MHTSSKLSGVVWTCAAGRDVNLSTFDMLLVSAAIRTPATCLFSHVCLHLHARGPACAQMVVRRYPSRPSKASIMDTMDGDALYGVAPVLAALTAGIRRPYALIMQEGLTASARKDGKALGEIQRLAAAAGAEMRTMSKHDLNMLSGNRCGRVVCW